jgi:SNF2 family DNA or RNA helicase
MTGSPVRVERAGARILLGSDLPLSGLKRTIPGAYFRNNEKIWSVPLDLETCRLLREQYQDRLVIGPGLAAWAREEVEKRRHAEATASAGDAELSLLPQVAPELYAAMSTRPYQKAAVRFVADAEGRDGRRRALIGDTVGLGKTVEALGAVLECGVPGPYLVVCPMGATELAWAPEIRRRLPGHEVVTLPSGRAKREAILDELMGREPALLARTWLIVHPAVVRTQSWFVCRENCGHPTKFKAGMIQELDCGHEPDGKKLRHDHEYPGLFQMTWGGIVADESDQMLIRLTGTPTLQRRGMEMLRDCVAPGAPRIAMSGTPFRSKPHQIWSTLNWLDPKRWTSKWNFVGRYWGLGGYSGYEIGAFNTEREQMFLDELKDVMIRRTREQVRSDLPPKIYADNRTPEEIERGELPAGIWLPLSSKQRKAYDGIVKAGYAEIEGGQLSPIGILAEMTRMIQFAGATGRLDDGEFIPQAEGSKFDWLVEFLKENGLPDRPDTKIVIASQFTRLLNAFRDGLQKEFKGLRIGMITGQQTGPQRTATVDEFEDPDSDLCILLLNTKAGGSAITLDAAEIMVILDETRVDDEQQQLEGRIDNRNPERKIANRTYYYLRSRDSIEEGIARANAEAKAIGGRILNNPNGIDFARRAMALSRGGK